MKRFWHKVELVVDKLIPLCLLLLLIIIIIEIFNTHLAHKYHLLIALVDIFIIATFTLDLIFKYIRMRDVPLFLRRYWLEIIAVFPFYLLFRFFNVFLSLFSFSEIISEYQMLFHEGLEIEKSGSRIIEGSGKSARFQKFIRFMRPALRLPRFLKMAAFFEKPSGHHHHHEIQLHKVHAHDIRHSS